MSALEGAVVYMELGRALAPSPHFVSAVMAAGVLLRAGTEEQKREWLPRIVTGEAILTTAWLEPGNGFGPRGVQARADGRRRRVRARRREVARAVRVVGDRGRRARTHGRCRVRRRPLPRRLGHAGRDDGPAAHDRVRHPIRGDLLGRAGPGVGADRRRRIRLGDLARDDARRNHPARRAGRRRGARTRSSSPCSTRRTASSSTSRSARSRRSRTTSPTP